MRRIHRAGFTLIELLVTVAIIGILVAIAAINYRNAIERARQRRAMGDIRTLSTTMEMYAMDLARYPPAAAYALPTGLSLPDKTLHVARGYLEPTYLRVVPLVDGWNSWFLYGTSDPFTDYGLRSAGRGGKADTDPAFGPTTNLDADIILVNGQFVQWPEGVQR
jgi:general secretion pathway protein G